jgi:capsular exopolysaccharide synthesis family protein
VPRSFQGAGKESKAVRIDRTAVASASAGRQQILSRYKPQDRILAHPRFPTAEKMSRLSNRLSKGLRNAGVTRRPPGVLPFAVTAADILPPQPVGAQTAPEFAMELHPEQCLPELAPRLRAARDTALPVVPAVNSARPEHRQEDKGFAKVPPATFEASEHGSVNMRATGESRLVALSAPGSLGAEKFRALATRLDAIRKQSNLKSFQVASSVTSDGKTLVAGNVAVTLAKDSGFNTLLIEGDLRKPALSALLGLHDSRGLSHWWSDQDAELAQFVYKANDMPLWFLSAGTPSERPSDILRSARFVKAFEQLASRFDWVVVDSTPMFPIVDVNLWSKLVDGTLLVVREGQTPVKALKEGLRALDQPNLIGVVINDVSGCDRAYYDKPYYGSAGRAAASRDKTT